MQMAVDAAIARQTNAMVALEQRTIARLTNSRQRHDGPLQPLQTVCKRSKLQLYAAPC
jgi:hypothetical protein